MDYLEKIGLTLVFAPLGAFAGLWLREMYTRWRTHRRYNHFRVMVIGRVKRQLRDIHAYHQSGHQVTDDRDYTRFGIRLSDTVLATLLDAGFTPAEAAENLTVACKDTHGRFSRFFRRLEQRASERGEFTGSTDVLVRDIIEYFEVGTPQEKES